MSFPNCVEQVDMLILCIPSGKVDVRKSKLVLVLMLVFPAQGFRLTRKEGVLTLPPPFRICKFKDHSWSMSNELSDFLRMMLKVSPVIVKMNLETAKQLEPLNPLQ